MDEPASSIFDFPSRDSPYSSSSFPRSSPRNSYSAGNGKNGWWEASSKNESSSDTVYEEKTAAWLDAIERSTRCLHRSSPRKADREFKQGQAQDHGLSTNELVTTIESALSYLKQLETAIEMEQLPATWRFPPKGKPPMFVPDHDGMIPFAKSLAMFDDRREDGPPSSPKIRVVTNGHEDSSLASNPFASIALSDEEDEWESSDSEEAGDHPVLNKKAKKVSLSLLRLLIRIHTSASDLLAHQGHSLATAHHWSMGAQALQCAIQKIHQALDLADSEISRYYHEKSTSKGSKRQLVALQEDADIVHVSIESLVRSKNRYLQEAIRRSKRLDHILTPQWESRDQVKAKMGDRWKNNPKPKNDYARLRQEHEAELKEIKTVLELLESTNLSSLANTVQLMKSRIAADNSHRYNGQRPEEQALNQVPRLEGYPDATDYDWLFTGSNSQSRVEFFEKVFDGNLLVKLDFYYSTGTIKTSMDHPKRGKTQLFASADQITPEKYIEILLNPRVHTTDLRYQRKENKPKRSHPR